MGCIRHLYDELIVPAKLESRPDMISEVNQLFDISLNLVVTATCFRVDGDTLRTQRQGGLAADTIYVNRERFQDFTGSQFHNTSVCVGLSDGAEKSIVLPNKLSDESILRLFIKHIGRSDLLYHAIIE